MEMTAVGPGIGFVPQPIPTTPTSVRWYMNTEDTQICLTAREACHAMRKSLLELISDDSDSQDLLERTTNAKELTDFVKFLQEKLALEREDPGFRRQLFNRVETFCVFAEKITQVVQVMVPQDPKFTIPYGCLALLFKIMTWNKERKDKLDAFLVSIVEVLPVAEAYAELYNTRQIKEVLALMYVTILEFLGKAIVYYRRNNLKKAVDGLFKPTSNRFEIYMTQLKQYTARLAHYQTLANAAQQDQTLKSVRDISGTLAIVRQEMELMSQEIFTKINQVENLWKANQELAKKDRNMIAHRELSSLAQLLHPESKPWMSELRYAEEENQEVSQRSHWQMRSVIEDLNTWSETVDEKPLLWLSVTAGNHGTWVTPMITEYHWSGAKDDVPLICIFAGVYQERQLNPKSVVSLLIIRIMEQSPSIVFDLPDLLNNRVLAHATNVDLWEILEIMLRNIRPALMIIDRIDLCDFQESQWPQFLGNMETMVSHLQGDLRVLFTSAEGPPDLVQHTGLFETMQSSARIKPSRRYDR